MKFTFCSIGFRTRETIQTIIPRIASYGYDGVEIWEGHAYIWQDKLDGKGLDHIPAIKELLDKHGIRCSMVSSYFGFTLPPNRWNDSLEMAKIYIKIARMLDCRLIRAFTGGPGSRDATKEQWDNTVKAYKILCEIAEDNDVTFALETHGNNLMDTVWGCLRLLEEINSERMAINFQPGAFPGQDPLTLYEKFWGRVVNLHLDSFSGNLVFLEALRRRNYQGFAAIEFGKEPLWEFAEAESRFIKQLRGS